MGNNGVDSSIGMASAVQTVDREGERQNSALEPDSQLSRGWSRPIQRGGGFLFGAGEEVQRLVYGVTPRGIFYGKWMVSTSLNSGTRAIAVESPSWKVFNYLANAENLKEWAVTEIESTTGETGSWLNVAIPEGQALLNIRIDPTFAVVDIKFVRSNQVWYFATRILTNNDQNCELVVTVLSPGPFGSKLFDRTIALVDQRLDCLKALMEGRS